MSLIDREREPVVVETSKLVSSLLPKNINNISNSRENQIIFFSDSNNDGTLYGLKYLNLGEQRPQLSWFKWKFNQPIKYHFIVDDKFYILDNDNFLQQVCLIQSDTEESITKDNEDYLVHLDNYVANISSGVFNSNTKNYIYYYMVI